MKVLDVIAGILLIVGGLNWGLVGLFNFDLVAAIFGTLTPLSRVIYILVALSAIYLLVCMKGVANRFSDQRYASTTTASRNRPVL